MAEQKSKIDGGDIAKGAAAVTIAAGVVAAGVLLSDKKNRKKVANFAGKGIKMAQEIAGEVRDGASDKIQEAEEAVPATKAAVLKKVSKVKTK